MSLETHRLTLMKVLNKRDADKILNDEQIKEYLEHHFEPNPADDFRTEE